MKYIIILLLIFVQVLIAQETIDKIVAVVDNEIILKSELDLRVQMEAAKSNINPDDPALRKKILNGMITEKLLYAQAELDSVEVSDDEITQMLDNQMNYFIQQYGSKERVEETYGMSIERIKREFRDDTKKNLMAQRLQQQKFGEIDVTRREVEQFYETYKDSLGLIPEKFTLSHIFIDPSKSENAKEIAKKFAESLLDSLKNGADFAVLATKYSDDPGSRAQGGDLGLVQRGVFYPEFEAAAFALKEGEISGVVESPVGFHIIQLLERKGNQIHTRHILVMIKSNDQADLKAIELLTDIKDSIRQGFNTFEYYAKKYSDDKETAKFGGKLGTLEVGQLDKQILQTVYSMKEGEISAPQKLVIGPQKYGYQIVKLIKRIPEHVANIDKDYDDIKRLAEYRKREKKFKEWVEELKSHIYWEVKI
ncbi:Periplasmic chaperone and peptidyl-prolyl cis-trans isomerase of outer membrane proteins SurA [hydrothermal vent metagenome]|uniref:Periplasmic chaperone and peptidyl-prolyl cis-trans isomerase of outer membrane proteins SurA n=1 Tax=hydrothermal vent metagenome TaxID=652676 RepID=A0A3B1BGQ9_9ZZZZ